MNGKLVRNYIPNIVADDTANPVKFRVLNDDEYKDALHKKLDEEVAEFHQSGDVEELVDIYEVLIALARLRGVSEPGLRTKAVAKRGTHGGFDKRYFLYTDDGEERSAKYPLRSNELCDSCRYGMNNDLCCGRTDCAICEMRYKPESPTRRNAKNGCYCLSLNEGDPCKYYTPIKEAPNDQT